MEHHPLSLRYLAAYTLTAVLSFFASIPQTAAVKAQSKDLDKKRVRKSRITVPRTEGGAGGIAVDVYERIQADGKAHEGPQAVHINFHGSGFILPSLGTDLEFCSHVAATAVNSTVVLDADYRKAPSHPFPAAPNDALSVLAYVLARPDSFDVSKITISGFSAGGNLAMGLAVSPLARGKIQALITMYANPDLTQFHVAPETSFKSGLILPGWLRTFFYYCYLLPDTQWDEPRISPGLAPTIFFPPHVFGSCGKSDSLYNPGERLIERLRTEGVRDAVWIPVEKAAHAWDKRTKVGSQAEGDKWRVYTAAVEMIDRAQK